MELTPEENVAMIERRIVFYLGKTADLAENVLDTNGDADPGNQYDKEMRLIKSDFESSMLELKEAAGETNTYKNFMKIYKTLDHAVALTCVNRSCRDQHAFAPDGWDGDSNLIGEEEYRAEEYRKAHAR